MGFNDENTRSAASRAADLQSGSPAIRRDALARSLCARICDERRSADVLEALDAVLTRFENETIAPSSLVDLLQNDRYAETEGNETERAHRRGWNAGMSHATSLVRAELGLAELRRQTNWPIDEAFDVGGES